MIGYILGQLVGTYLFILIARAIISFLPLLNIYVSRGNPIVNVIYQLTDPPLIMLRQYIPPTGGFDLSFLILYILLQFLQRFLINLPF